MDLDGWSEADLLAEYKAALDLDNVQVMDAAQGLKDPVGERVRALNYLETVLSVIPSATDRLESWFARSTAKCLRNRGIITLADLVHFINAHGYRWHARIKGFGRQRAEQVLAWLVLAQEHLNLLVSGNVYEPKTKQAARVAELLPAQGFSVTALSQFGAGTLAVGDGSGLFSLCLFTGSVTYCSRVHLILAIDGNQLGNFMRDFQNLRRTQGCRSSGLPPSIWMPRYDRLVIVPTLSWKQKWRYLHRSVKARNW